MEKKDVLAQLQLAEGYVSGQTLSQALGVSRMAVNKAVEALRAEGYVIDAAPRRGYRLDKTTEELSEAGILLALSDHPWRDRIHILDSVDSTNNELKSRALLGAPEGSILIARQQTGGRGRLGRSFSSPPGGLYLSVLLRPNEPPQSLMHLTAMAAVASCAAIEAACGLQPKIKWTNDLVCGQKKICGILTELSLEAESAHVGYCVIGIGINCNTLPSEFPPELQDMASSLRMQLGKSVDINALAAQLIVCLYRMQEQMLSQKAAWMARYRAACITVGQDICVRRGDELRYAHADAIGDNAELLIHYRDGEKAVLNSGEVSVRGMYGYVSRESLEWKL